MSEAVQGTSSDSTSRPIPPPPIGSRGTLVYLLLTAVLLLTVWTYLLTTGWLGSAAPVVVAGALGGSIQALSSFVQRAVSGRPARTTILYYLTGQITGGLLAWIIFSLAYTFVGLSPGSLGVATMATAFFLGAVSIVLIERLAQVFQSLTTNGDENQVPPQAAMAPSLAASANVAVSSEDATLEQTLQARLSKQPQNVAVARQLIEVRRRLRRYEEAAEVYDALIGLDPENIDLVREKASLYEEMGDRGRYVKTLEQAERIQASTSFRENLGTEILLRRIEIRDLEFFSDFEWRFRPRVNVLLGKNGYGKSHLLRALVGMIQNEEKVTAEFFNNSRTAAAIQIDIVREQRPETAVRRRLVFEKSFGKAPVLAIPDMRYVDKSTSTISSPGGETTDLRGYSAWHFLHDKPYDGMIINFLYDLCFDYLDHGKTFDQPIFQLIQDAVRQLTDGGFRFRDIVRRGQAAFEILVSTEGNESSPLPLQKASQGTLSVLAMFGLTYKYLKAIHEGADEKAIKEQQGIVVIDEIDAHLHPSWQQKILPLFYDTFPNVQFVVTAHSPLVVAGCKEGEVSVLQKGPRGFQVEVLDEHFIGASLEDLYQRIFRVEEKDPTYLELNSAYARKGEIETDLETLNKTGELSKSDATKRDQLRDQLYYLRQFEEVRDKHLEEADSSRELSRLQMETTRLRGEVSSLKKELAALQPAPLDEEGDPFEPLRDLDLAQPDSVQRFAQYLAGQRRFAEAAALFEALLKIRPDNPEYLKAAAVHYENLQDYARAAGAVQRALKLEPENADLQAVSQRLGGMLKNS